ncbi:hypothetical protein V8D89_001037 [Ganoderma adspersum]
MPKSQSSSNILPSSEWPLAATTAATAAGASNININIDHVEVKPSKLQLPAPAVAIRKALYADGKEPTEDEIAQAYTEIVAIVPGYSKKVHSNYFSSKRRGRISGRDTIATGVQNAPNPTIHDIILWKLTTGLSYVDVFRIVMAEVPDIVKERAKTEYLVLKQEMRGNMDVSGQHNVPHTLALCIPTQVSFQPLASIAPVILSSSLGSSA